MIRFNNEYEKLKTEISKVVYNYLIYFLEKTRGWSDRG